MQGDLRVIVGSEIIRLVLQEVKEEIKNNGVNRCEQVNLLHQLGSLYGLLDKTEKQKEAWQKALELDPDNQMILSSLESLKK